MNTPNKKRDPFTEGVYEDEELTAFTAAKDFPGRLKCATLAWEAMDNFLRT